MNFNDTHCRPLRQDYLWVGCSGKKGEQCMLYFNVRIAPGVRMGCTGVRNFHIYYTRLLANLFGSSLKVLVQEILANSSALGIQPFDKHTFCFQSEFTPF